MNLTASPTHQGPGGNDIRLERVTMPILGMIGVIGVIMAAAFALGSFYTQMNASREEADRRLFAIERDLGGLRTAFEEWKTDKNPFLKSAMEEPTKRRVKKVNNFIKG